MDFNFSEEQDAIRSLADEVFTSKATIERTKEIELSVERVDRELWRELATTGLLGIALPEEFGGGGLGLSELYTLLEEQGRHVAAVPIWETTLAALAINEFGSDSLRAELLPGVADGSRFLTVGLEEFGPYTGGDPLTTATQDADGNWTLSGEKAVVPITNIANLALISATTSTGTALLLVDLSADGVAVEQTQSTNHEICANLTFSAAPAQLIGAADGTTVPWLIDRVELALAAIQWGVGSGAVAQAVTYLNGRMQFGRPLATFQAVNHQLADCYIDLEAMRVTLWQAAWRISEGWISEPRYSSPSGGPPTADSASCIARRTSTAAWASTPTTRFTVTCCGASRLLPPSVVPAPTSRVWVRSLHPVWRCSHDRSRRS